ncbi:MAG TPA: HPF/RaiA family ribosome-associated protein [Nocardioides sp.]|nr:HPF/RaiA family ribosome-associated protein [Nocardioides sp.]
MSTTTKPIQVEVTLRGNVGSGAGDYARTKIAKALGVAQGPVLSAYVVLDWRHDPAILVHAVAEASADVDGHVVRARTAAPSMVEAVDELESRLRGQLVQLADRNRTRHRWTGVAAAHEWRHGDLVRRPVPYFPRPAETREVVRHKSFASEPMTVDEAAYEMDLLDHDFFLYRDAASGGPALVHRRPDGGLGVAGVEQQETVAAVTYEPQPATLTDDQARERLEAADEPFVFYREAASGHGRVLYHRYDGHYGLIELTG